MANYESVTRTNYFRVTDEKRYEELYNRLRGYADQIYPFDKKTEDGTILHGFGSYGEIEYYPPELENEEDCDSTDLDIHNFYRELQKILPDNEVFILEQIGDENLRYLTAYAHLVTNKEIRQIVLHEEIKNMAKELTGNKDYTLNIEY